jgi:hypothetical protein
MNGLSKESPIATGQLGLYSLCAVVLLAGLTVCIGCAGGPAMFLNARDQEINNSTQAIETARDDAHRAKAYSSRGDAYSEKARYSRLSKLISDDEMSVCLISQSRIMTRPSHSIRPAPRFTSTGRRRTTIVVVWT